ncbi:VWA domain-containing protein [Hymenobacter rubidus]|uniref:VWA domain-containing protein n=1 Tax=Hymenobacter rubidus TaxID=1441626 RepID=UPI00191F7D97|nr:VWA domain-containing protein [Hymenobacter rubidus]
MISFEHPYYLLYAGVLPVLVVGYLVAGRRTARALRGTALAGAGDALLPGRQRHWSHLRFGLRLLAYAALVLAIATPQAKVSRASAPVTGNQRLVFAVDVSNSMLATDLLPDRLSQAKKLIEETVQQLRGEEVALVVFAGNARLYMPLTTDYNVVRRACSAMSPELITLQGTSFADALGLAGQVLKASPRQGGMLCILSDGEIHTAHDAHLADSLHRAGIELVAVGIGTPEGAPIPVSNAREGTPDVKRDRNGAPIRTRLEEDNLKALVQGRANRYIRLDTWRDAAARLLPMVRELEKPAQQSDAPWHLAYFQLCLVAAFGLLLLELLLAFGVPL